MQERKDARQVLFKTGVIQGRKREMQERKDAGRRETGLEAIRK